ncbi:DUF1330 domain-containing protein [Jatrophihabitans lederbergiae]|uniref:DUF1330 domain-containing protein n=1 Tax=Jatrophihabitans lederbergiae TaxID=3075547 RepID=A0ABU2JF44_9ACTN|nr:hypothetical protein [Jatrophihabitans sp. DSM 44399]MDT0263600.1 hypothetical protein [Jatrophihabitans sp. DSM 44399]
MATTEINPQDLRVAVDTFPADQPVLMVNLLRFNTQADYSAAKAAATDTPLPAASGQEVYLTRYLPAFSEAMAPLGISEVVFAGMVAARLVGPSEARWDAVAVATYPSIKAFRDLVEDPGYLSQAAPHRLAALADWQLFATAALNPSAG